MGKAGNGKGWKRDDTGRNVEKVKEGYRGEEGGRKARQRQANINLRAGKQASRKAREQANEAGKRKEKHSFLHLFHLISLFC